MAANPTHEKKRASTLGNFDMFFETKTVTAQVEPPPSRPGTGRGKAPIPIVNFQLFVPLCLGGRIERVLKEQFCNLSAFVS